MVSGTPSSRTLNALCSSHRVEFITYEMGMCAWGRGRHKLRGGLSAWVMLKHRRDDHRHLYLHERPPEGTNLVHQRRRGHEHEGGDSLYRATTATHARGTPTLRLPRVNIGPSATTNQNHLLSHQANEEQRRDRIRPLPAGIVPDEQAGQEHPRALNLIKRTV